MLSFKQYLEMAVVAKQPVPLDSDDIAYLKQFPQNRWSQALKWRYNDFIFKAVDGMGRIKRGWRDTKPITIVGKTYTVDTGMTKVVEKLRQLGYDLRGMNEQTKTSLYFRPLTIGSARAKVYQLRINKLAPNTVSFEPNKMETQRNDPEVTEKWTSTKRSDFEKQRPEIEKEVENKVYRAMGNIGQDDYRYVNLRWWNRPENIKKLMDTIHERIWLNWNNPKVHTKEGRDLFIRNEINKALQGGIVTRRTFDAFKDKGLNLGDTIRQPWNHDNLKNVLSNPPRGPERNKWYGDRINLLRNPVAPQIASYA